MAYPVNLGQILAFMGYKSLVDFEVVDMLDGNGPTIAEWNHADPQPTESDVTTFYAAYESSPDRLNEYKALARYKVDQAAEYARLRYITNGAGQAMVYQLKGAEAEAYITAGYPVDTSSYPFIQAEMNATGKTKEQAADDIITQRNAWVALGASIEQQRLAGKGAVDAAIDEVGVDSARDTAVTILDGI